MKRKGNPLPAYQVIQAAIRRKTESGRLKPGDAVDSERELARKYQVSLMTARHALSVLQQEGIVQRRRGAGTFVAPPKIHFNKLLSFSEQMAGRNVAANSKVLDFGRVEKEHEIEAKLAIAPGSELLRIERLRLGSESTFALETCYLPSDDFPGLTRALVEHGSLFALLQRNYSVQLSYADEEIDATVADARAAKLLRIARGASLLRIRQVLYSTQSKPVAYTIGLYPSDRHKLLVRRYR